MKRMWHVAAAFAAVLMIAPTGAQAAGLKVVATTQDLESIAKEVGGDKVQTDSLAKGYQDPHFVEPKPSFILKLHSADLLIAVGREAGIELVAAARQPVTQPAHPAHRRSVLRCVVDRPHPGDPDRPDYARDGGCPPVRQSPLLARPG